MSNNRLLLLKLNNYLYEKEYNDVINYLKTKTIPSNCNTNFKINRFVNRWNSFDLRNNKLFYTSLNLEVIIDDDEKKEKMKELYEDEKTMASGIRSFYDKITQQYLNIKMKDAKEFIEKQTVYQLTSQPKLTINKPIHASYCNQIWMIDLIDVNYYKSINNRWKEYILTVIDVFSRYVFAVALKNKSASTIIDAFEEILLNQSQGIYPTFIQSDNGTEFTNKDFAAWCKNKNIGLRFNKTYSPTGNALVENFNKYLRKLIQLGFVKNNNLKWYENLDDYVYNRNHTKHGTTKYMPVSIWTPTKTEIIKNDIPDGDDVLTKNQLQNKVLIKTRQQVQKKLDKYKDEMLVVGDKVRIHLSAISSQVRKAIKEGNGKKVIVKYTPKIYTIREIIRDNQKLFKPRYYLSPDDYTRSFFYSELLRVDSDSEDSLINEDKLNKI